MVFMPSIKNKRSGALLANELRHFPHQQMPESKCGVNIISCAVSPFKALLENNDERTVFMQSILEELYCGNIRHDARFYGQDSPFVEAARLKSQSLEKLMASLDDSEKELFEKYCDAQGEIEGITRYDTFTYALKFGILLAMDVMKEAEVIANG